MIYLDYNATHPPFAKIIESAHKAYISSYGNSSGRSAFSQKSESLIEKSRKKIGNIFSVSEHQIIFTSSATEANFLAIHLLYNYLKKIKAKDRLLVGVSPFEHPSTIEVLKKKIAIDIIILPLNKNGQLDLVYLEDAFQNKMFDFLVCTLAHNETGIIQPWEIFFNLLSKFSIPLICDVVQVVSRLQNNVASSNLRYDIFAVSKKISIFFTMSGHKIGAGFGAGIMIMPLEFADQKQSALTPFYESGQEYALRPGSHNLVSILAFEKVLSERVKKKNYNKLIFLTQAFETSLIVALRDIINIKIIGTNLLRLAGTTMVIFKNLPIDFFLIGLDEANIVVSTGTSCKSKSRIPSPGLLALGLSETEALEVIRFSYNECFSLEQQSYVIKMVREIIQKLI